MAESELKAGTRARRDRSLTTDGEVARCWGMGGHLPGSKHATSRHWQVPFTQPIVSETRSSQRTFHTRVPCHQTLIVRAVGGGCLWSATCVASSAHAPTERGTCGSRRPWPSSTAAVTSQSHCFPSLDEANICLVHHTSVVMVQLYMNEFCVHLSGRGVGNQIHYRVPMRRKW
ncbi:hypothetical protein HD554DRAFT_2136803 [Boletus coccyginus]|nr:hypothetical protein HD554DRAFT_2145838 [Boletus coccyginus]KAI9459334.1 hypothetical protein HD554DRAFT_2136803 [Boletus coccyginus]